MTSTLPEDMVLFLHKNYWPRSAALPLRCVLREPRAACCAPLLPRRTLRELCAACCASFRPWCTLREPRSVLRVFPTVVYTARTPFKFHMFHTKVLYILHHGTSYSYSSRSIALQPAVTNDELTLTTTDRNHSVDGLGPVFIVGWLTERPGGLDRSTMTLSSLNRTLADMPPNRGARDVGFLQ